MPSDLTTTTAAQYLTARLARRYTSNAIRQIIMRGRWLQHSYSTLPGNKRGVWMIPQADLDEYIQYKQTRRKRRTKEEQ